MCSDLHPTRLPATLGLGETLYGNRVRSGSIHGIALYPVLSDCALNLRGLLGVVGCVVSGSYCVLKVELDHARLAMLAVLLTGAVGAGTGMPSGFVDAHVGFSSVRVASVFIPFHLALVGYSGSSNGHARM